MNLIDSVDAQSLRNDIPDFRPGDTVNVHVKVIEGSKERIQVFKGIVVRRQGSGIRETFTVRKMSFGVGVERTFPVHSPNIDKIDVAVRGDVRPGAHRDGRGLPRDAARPTRGPARLRPPGVVVQLPGRLRRRPGIELRRRERGARVHLQPAVARAPQDVRQLPEP